MTEQPSRTGVPGDTGGERSSRIITFYSYKGGTGRTMTLANTAWILAASGKRVLIVDWDLEAPGLARFFLPFLSPAVLESCTGVIDLIEDYRELATEQRESDADYTRPISGVEEAAQVFPHVIPLNWGGFAEHGGCLDFLPAGQVQSDYAGLVASINWDHFYEQLDGARFFRALAADMRQSYDYILIDSRTGLSDISEICTVEMPDDLVVCYTLSGQSIEGASDIAQRIAGRHGDRGIRIFPVATRIDDGEKEKADAGRALARKRFAGLPQHMNEAEREHHWGSVEIPYQAFYAYEEILAPFGDKPGSPTSMLSACERLVTALTDGALGPMPAMDEHVRLHYAELFTRPRPAAREDVVLSFVAEDRMWAEWIEWMLGRAGLRVIPRELGLPARTDSERLREAVARTVAVWSPAYARAVQARAAREILRDDRSEERGEIITARVGESRPTGAYQNGNSLDLLSLDESAATAALLRAVNRAEASLEYVPGEGPRYPGLKPAIFNPRLRNASFTGRAEVLDRLRRQLRDRKSTAVLPTPQTLYGLGGVGKTQVALEYAYRYMADYDLVWWIESEEPEQVAVSFTELARRLELRVGDVVAETVNLVKETLRLGVHPKAKRWLLIFDNADDPSSVVDYFPGGSGDVLVTSRNQSWSGYAEPLSVDVFQRSESVNHLVRRVPGLSPRDADLVAEAVGDLPLAVEIAAAWLETTGVPVATYVEQLRNEAVPVLDAAEPTDYPTTFGATWKVSIARLREQSPAAARLLQLWAFFAPDSISRSLVYSDQMINALVVYDDDLRDKYMMGKLLRAIGRYGLARVDNSSPTFQVHRMVQAVIKTEMSDEEFNDTIHEAHRILVGARPDEGDTDDPANWPQFELIWPHLNPSNAEGCDEPETRQLLIDRVRYLWKRGDLDRAEDLGRRLDARWSETLGADDRQTLQLRFQLGNVLRSQGRFEECRVLDQDTLDRQRRVLRRDHPQTLQTAGSLAADLRSLGDFRQALELDRVTYDKLREELGEDDQLALRIANNLAIDLRFTGDYEAARVLDEDVLHRRTDVLGPLHPYTLTTKAALAEDLRALGDYKGSISLLQEFREEYAAAQDDLPSLRYAKSLAVALRKAGQQAEGRRITVETYNRYLERYHALLPDALACALNLAAEYSASGDKEAARDTAWEVYQTYVTNLGERHPFTLICANNLTIYQRDAGQVQDALALGETTLRILEETLGEKHPYTLCARLNLANSYGDDGQLARAEQLGRESAEGLAERYGADHPDAVVCRANLAITLRDRGARADAQELRERSVRELVRILGDDHQATQSARSWKRMGRDLELLPS